MFRRMMFRRVMFRRMMLLCDGRLFCNNFSNDEVFPVDDDKLKRLAEIVAEGRKMQDRMAVIGIIADYLGMMEHECNNGCCHPGIAFRLNVSRSKLEISVSDAGCSSNNITAPVSESEAAELADVIREWITNLIAVVRADYERL